MARTTDGFRAVLSSRITLGYALVIMFDFGAFFSFLSSTELVFADIFDRANLFVPYFASSSALFAIVAVSLARLMPRLGAVTIARTAASGLVALSAVLYMITVAADGVPEFWLWIAVLTAANCCHTAILPTCSSLALEPMGARAGTAAGVLGLIGGAGGALLATFTNRAISGTATPMAVGYLGYSSAALLALWWASTARRPLLS